MKLIPQPFRRALRPFPSVERIRRFCYCFMALATASALACGPDFPNWFLGGGEQTLITAPTAQFRKELDRMRLEAPPHAARLTGKDHPSETVTAEQADLDQALDRAKIPAAERTPQREALRQARLTGVIDASAQLPAEFGEYARGAWLWQAGQKDPARALWLGILARPAEERHFKSTWAAYMLGRSSDTNEWDQAIERYQQVRTLTAEGFSDSLGLAAASYGWEAQLRLRQQDYLRAIELYLRQLGSGDGSAVVSLRETARRALSEATPTQLLALARQEQSRRVIGSWLISGTDDAWAPETQLADSKNLAGRWLAAVEAAGIRDLATGEQLALAAYQVGDLTSARRWIQRAPTSPTVQWLNAKFWLRAGKIDKAAEILARIAGHFPLATPTTAESRSQGLISSLWTEEEAVSAPQQFHAELGVLRLLRREYSQALDALIRADFWMDAAYVAERVLTLDELKTYVDRHWPELPPDEGNTPSDPAIDESAPEGDAARENRQRASIRHLLGRRLARDNRAEEASPYLPPAARAQLESMIEGMRKGSDESLTKSERAGGWWQAAQVARAHGLELMGTELEPDWSVHGAHFEAGVTLESRLAAPPYATPSSNELSRVARHAPQLNKRFHYRYTAAAMAWQAAELLPNNDDETARILCTAGSWIKIRDPQAADVFYKSLVRRCRKTPIGNQADAMRWFPALDADGNPLPRKPAAPPTPPEPEPNSEPNPDPNPEPNPEPEPVAEP